MTQAPIRGATGTTGPAAPRTPEASSNSEAPDTADKKDDESTLGSSVEQSDPGERSDTSTAEVVPGGADGDRRSAIERAGLDTRNGDYPEWGTDTIPDDRDKLVDGRILGVIPEDLITGRDKVGRITEVGGKPIDRWHTELLMGRVEEINAHRDKFGQERRRWEEASAR
ncbi:hypothetical protein [Nocardiopsis synnemataformans]|uniref:hypothetical protein n=1 Tax=Nocardiopsis synnemataformans TaxID=61305 RepID=UPI003EBC3C84